MDFQFALLCNAQRNYNTMMAVNSNENLPLPLIPHQAPQINVPQAIQTIFDLLDWEHQNALNFSRVGLQMITTFTHQRYRDRLLNPDNQDLRDQSEEAFNTLVLTHTAVIERFVLFVGPQLAEIYDDYNDDSILEFLSERVIAVVGQGVDVAPNVALLGSG